MGYAIAELPERIIRRARKRVQLTSAAVAADAFLTSYPKSGRTWFRYILSNYFSASAGLDAEVSLHNMFRIVPNFAVDAVRGIPAFRACGEEAGVPLILVSHNNYRQTIFLRAPVVFMVRDPRDVLVSAFFHATRHKGRFSGDFDAFIADKDQGLPVLVRYLNGWAAGLPRHRHFILTYERLTDAPEETTADVLRFLRCDVDREKVELAVALSRFEAMQDRERQEGIPDHSYDVNDSEALRMRKGKVGGHADYLTPAQAALIEAKLASGLTPAARAMVAQTGCRLG